MNPDHDLEMLMHVMLWHTAVIALSAAAGALLAWLLRFRAGSGPHSGIR